MQTRETVTCKECQYSFRTFDKTHNGVIVRVCLLGYLGETVEDFDYCSKAIKREVIKC